MTWPRPVTDEQAVFFALSTIASWQEWCSTGGPNLEDATRLVMQRRAEAQMARGEIAVALKREQWAQVMVALYAGTQESVLTDEQADAIEVAILESTGPLEDRHRRPREASDV